MTKEQAEKIATRLYDMAWQRGSTREISIARITEALTASSAGMTAVSDTKLDHPCKETCSGWKQGYEAGVAASSVKVPKQQEEIAKLKNMLEVAVEALQYYETIGSNIALPIHLCGPLSKKAKWAIDKMKGKEV